jgi:UDP:flavonoid glycosyltransferase YjiC (YdhE family)
MRILLASTKGAGHLGPIFPFAHALLRAGHELLVAAPHAATHMVERAGLTALPIGHPTDEELGPVWARVGPASAEEKERIVVTEIFGRLYTRAALPAMLEAVDGWRPDLVLRESAEFSSSLAAEVHGVPQARVSVLLGQEEGFLGYVPGVLGELRAELGLPPDHELETIRRSPNLSLAPASFEPGGPSTLRFRAEETAPAPRLPDWWPGDPRPLAYVTLGTAAPQMDFFPELFRAVVEGLEQVPARVLFTVGDTRDPAEFGPVPGNVHVERWVPQAAILPHAAVVACHGGSGSTLGALAHGLPLAVLPLFADQPYNASRVEELGAGIALHGGPAAATRVGDALSTLLADRAYRVAAGRVASEIAAFPPVDEAVPALEELAMPAPVPA